MTLVLPAGFGRCRRCGRLLVVDSHNVTGACTRDCGGDVGQTWRAAPTPATARVLGIARQQMDRWHGALDLMAER